MGIAAAKLDLPMTVAQPSCRRVNDWADQHDQHDRQADLAEAPTRRPPRSPGTLH